MAPDPTPLNVTYHDVEHALHDEYAAQVRTLTGKLAYATAAVKSLREQVVMLESEVERLKTFEHVTST